MINSVIHLVDTKTMNFLELSIIKGPQYSIPAGL